MFQGIGQDLATAIIIYVVVTCALFFIVFDLCFRIISRHKNEIAKDITNTVKDMIGSAPVLLAKPIDVKAEHFDISDGYHTVEELYNHRHALFINLMWQWYADCWWSKVHADGTFYEGYLLCGISLPSGNVTYHLPANYSYHLPAEKELPKGKVWDGHTSEDVIKRRLDSSFKK